VIYLACLLLAPVLYMLNSRRGSRGQGS